MPLDRTAKREIRNLKGLRRESVNPAALSRRPSTEEPLLVEEGDPERAPVSPAHHHHQQTGGGRDGRALWGLARNNLSTIRRQAAGASAEPPQPSSAHRTDAPARVDDDDAYTTSTVIEKLLFNLHAAKSRRSLLSERTLSDTEAGGGEGGGGRAGSEAASVTARAFAPASDARHLLRMLRSSYLNVLLLAIPLAIISGALKASPVLVFSASFTALLPLALILGEITEDLALRFGDAIGGLLNATFGNAVEMILGLAALFKGLNKVVAASMIGSVLSNLLLVMGCSFLFAGLRYKGSRFNTLANKVSCSLLFLATISIMIPTAARVAYGKDVVTDRTITQLSRAIAAVLLIL
jgi:Ca2+/Na+ antiporter